MPAEDANVNLVASEYEALRDMYESTNGPKWMWLDDHATYGIPWDFSNSSATDPCMELWQGLTCYYHQCGTAGCHLNMMNLTALNMDGTLPPAMGDSFPRLAYLGINDNKIRGHMPVLNMPDLQMLNFSYNAFSGPIPDTFGATPQLYLLYLSNNQFESTIPPSMYTLPALEYLNLYNNNLKGALSEQVSVFQLLSYLNVAGNYLTGALPQAIFRLPLLTRLFLGTNEFTGTLPEYLGSSIEVFRMCDNHLSGTLPAAICVNSNLQLFSIFNNKLTGTLPSCLSAMGKLNILQLQGNALRGTLDGVFDHQQQLQLSVVDVSDNALTGTLPDDLFALPQLKSIAAGKNCFHGSIPETICSADWVRTIAMDGLASSDTCICSLWDPMGVSNTDFGGIMEGGIPRCIWTLPNITVLHLAGNGLMGSLPDHVDCVHGLSPSLSDVVLTHNKLTGTIPMTFQGYPFSVLDLSYNKLRGNIEDMTNLTLAYSPNSPGATLHLGANRLSGDLPTDFASAYNIDILTGNMFQCRMNGEEMAKHDHGSQTAICGSQELDGSVAIMWMLVVIAVIVVLVVSGVSSFVRRNYHHIQKAVEAVRYTLRYCKEVSTYPVPTQVEIEALRCAHYNPDNSANSNMSLQSRQYYNVFQLLSALSLVRRLSWLVAGYALVVCLPIYVTFYKWDDNKYSTHTDRYGWVASAAFLTGEMPAAVLFIMWSVLMVCVLLMIIRHYNLHRVEEDGAIASMLRMFSVASSKVRDSIRGQSFMDIRMCAEECTNKPRSNENSGQNADMLGEVADEEDPLAASSKSKKSSKSSKSLSERISLLQVDKMAQLVEMDEIKVFWMTVAKYCSIFAINIAVALSINAAYLIAQNDQEITSTNKIIIQVLMAAFKIFWNVFALRVLTSQLPCMRATIILHVGMLVFNSILAPCIATALTDSACFRECFVAPESISVSYEFTTCIESYQQYDLEHDTVSTICTHYQASDFATVFTPTMIYYYTCGSKLITIYTPVFIYIYTMLLVFLPAFYFILGAAKTESIPKSLVRHIDGAVRPNDRGLVTFERLVRPYAIQAMMVHHVIVMLTFGVACPTLAAVMAAALTVDTLMWQVIIVRYIKYDSKDSPFAPAYRPKGLAVCLSISCLSAGDCEDVTNAMHRLPMTSTAPTYSPLPSQEDSASNHTDDIMYRLLYNTHTHDASEQYEQQVKEEARLYELHTVCGESWKSIRSTMWLVLYCVVFFYSCGLFDMVGDGNGWMHGLWVIIAGVIFVAIMRLSYIDSVKAAYDWIGGYSYRDVQNEDDF